jgi:hypothetical protein
VTTQVQIELWVRLDEELRSVLADARLSEDCACETNEYLHHNDYVLAWETLNACLRDADQPIRDRLRAIEALMYPPDLGW